MIDKFFLVGAIASLIGGIYTGAYLWLMLNGQLAVSPRIVQLRTLHALVQTYVFFGLFILGFLLQTAPKLLKVPDRTHPVFLTFIPLLFTGVCFEFYKPESLIGKTCLSAPFFMTLLYVIRLTNLSTSAFRETYSWWVILSLIGLSISPFFSVLRPENALVFLWSGVVSVTFAAGQQFLFAFLGGKRLSRTPNRVVFGLFLSSFGLMFWARESESSVGWQAAGAFGFLALALYIFCTASLNATRKLNRDPLAVAFCSGYCWALFGMGTLALTGSNALDSVFHLLVLGWLTPLIIAVSSQVLRAISGKFWLTPNALISLLLIWQLVPFGRGMRQIMPLAPAFSLLVIIAVATVTLAWSFAVGLSATRIMKGEIA